MLLLRKMTQNFFFVYERLSLFSLSKTVFFGILSEMILITMHIHRKSNKERLKKALFQLLTVGVFFYILIIKNAFKIIKLSKKRCIIKNKVEPVEFR